MAWDREAKDDEMMVQGREEHEAKSARQPGAKTGDDQGPSWTGRSGISRHSRTEIGPSCPNSQQQACHTYESLKPPTTGGGPEDDAESGKTGVIADGDGMSQSATPLTGGRTSVHGSRGSEMSS